MFKYTPHFIPSAIYLVGCGGTGSRLVPMLSQLVRTVLQEFNPQGWLQNLPVFLIDDDTVEEKNLMRQNFIAQDVGKRKAIVLAERYQRGMGIPIHPIISRVRGSDTIRSLDAPSFHQGELPRSNIILIMAVDSPQARRDILNAFIRTSNNDVFIIDAGNEDNFGQVKFFTNTLLMHHSHPYSWVDENLVARTVVNIRASLPKMVPEPMPVNYIPYSPTYYNRLGTTVAERSCAELDQTLAINAMMATIMCGILQNFLYIKPFTYNQINYSLNGSVSTVFNSGANWFSDENITRVNGYGDALTTGLYVNKIGDPWGTAREEKLTENQTYVSHVKESLSKMGLSLDLKTGEVSQKPPPALKEVPVAKSPRKKKSLTIERLGELLDEDISF